MSKRLRCKDCKNSDKYSDEEPCSTCYGYENFEEKKKQLTNADEIRSMSDYELAKLLIYSEENYKLFTTDGKDFYTYEEALKHEIELLKSPTTD